MNSDTTIQTARPLNLPNDWSTWASERRAVINQRTVNVTPPSLTLGDSLSFAARGGVIGGLACGITKIASYVFPINPDTKTYVAIFGGFAAATILLEYLVNRDLKKMDSAASEVETLFNAQSSSLQAINDLKDKLMSNGFTAEDWKALFQLSTQEEATKLKGLSSALSEFTASIGEEAGKLANLGITQPAQLNELEGDITRENREEYCSKAGGRPREERETIYDAMKTLLEKKPAIQSAMMNMQEECLSVLRRCESEACSERKQLAYEYKLLTSTPEKN